MEINKVKPSTRVYQIVLIFLLAITLIMLGSLYLPAGIDWRDTYRPATLALLTGESPYKVDIFFAAPWGLIPLIPFAILPEAIGRAALLLIGLGSFAYTAHKLGGKTIALIAFLLSPPVMHCLLNSNIEWLPLLGFILPPQIGLFFISIKPQIGVAVGIFWFIEAWRKGGYRNVIHVFWPITLALLISFAIFGFWPMRFRETIFLTRGYNASLWPGTIPVGLALLVAAIHKRNIKFAIASSPCLSPYVLLHAWTGALVSFVSQPIETIAAVIGLWILVIIRGFNWGLF
jgi:hypothetical protein